MGSDSKLKTQSQDEKDRVYGMKCIGLSFLTQFFVAYCCSKYLPASPNHKTIDITERIIFALRWQALSVFALAAGILWVVIIRALTPAINPLAEHGKKYVEVPVRYVTNTTEEYILHAIGCLALSTRLTPDTIMVLPVLSVLFVTGRLLFAIGYVIGPRHRVYGFSITFWPSVFALSYSVYSLVKETFA